jgi:hypothetical protein
VIRWRILQQVVSSDVKIFKQRARVGDDGREDIFSYITCTLGCKQVVFILLTLHSDTDCGVHVKTDVSRSKMV